jgi:hypothetical protein
MSILEALKTQSNSIDDLAKLPQAMIMQMAQKGQIRQDMIAPILARKAELTQAVANTRAMQQQQGGAKPTVMEQIMSQNAMAEAPVSDRDVGLAQLPVRDDMYAPQRMAGGGIVAFQNNMDQPVDENMPRQLTEEERAYLEQNPYLRRSRAVANLGSDLKEAFTNPSNYNPLSLYQRYVGQPFSEAANRFVNADMNKTFRTGQQARTGEIPMFVGNEPTTKGKMVAEGRMKPNENVVDVMKRERELKALTPDRLNEIARGQGVFPEGSSALPGANNTAPEGKRGNVSTKPGDKPKAEPAKAKEEEPLYSKYEKMLMDEREASKADREQAKYARMLEAGLGILGGSSQYAFENIGKGAAPALKGYGEDIKGLRAEERGRVKELLGIEGMRQDAKRSAQDLDLKRQMLEVQRLAATKPSQTEQIIALGKSSGLSDREIMGMLSGAAKDPDLSARNIAMKAFYESPVLQAQYKNDINAFLKAQGIGAGAGGQAPLNYVPGKGVV